MKRSMFKIHFLLFICSILISSCSSDDDSSNDIFEPVNVSYQTLGQSTLDGDEGIPKSNLVIDNEADWSDLLNQMDSTGNNVTDSFSRTEVDFDTHQVVAVFFEQRPNFWTVDIISIVENEDEVNVSFSDTGMISGPSSQAFHIVEIERIEDKPFVFENID